MGKTRIGERLSKLPASENSRHTEIDKYNEKYVEFSKTFKPLASALKNHHANLVKLGKSEGEVLAQFSKIIHDTPVAVSQNNAAQVREILLKKDNAYTEKYMHEIIDYVHEWELVVKTRVEAIQKQVKDFKTDLGHYEKKMESLSKAHEQATTKGKTHTPGDVEKLKRNEEKLALAKASYESQATRLVELIEAVVDCAWKDLIPLLLRMMKMESDILGTKKTLLSTSEIIENLQNLADEYKIDVTTPPPGPIEKAGAKVIPTKQQ